MPSRVVAIFTLLIAAGPASAQPDAVLAEAYKALYGTLDTSAVRMTSQGKLTGCSVNFNLLFRDWVHSQGRPYIVSGSFGLYQNTASGAVFGLKVVMNEQRREGGKVQSIPAPVHFAYLETEKANNAASHIETAPTDSAAEGRLFVFDAFTTASATVLTELLDTERVTLAFNTTRGGWDAKVPIDLTVIGTDAKGQRKRARDTVVGWGNCVTEFLPLVQEHLESRKGKK